MTKHRASDTHLGDSTPKFMNGIQQRWYGLLLAVDSRDRDIMGILNSVCGTSSSMHVHQEPSFSRTMFSYVIKKTD